MGSHSSETEAAFFFKPVFFLKCHKLKCGYLALKTHSNIFVWYPDAVMEYKHCHTCEPSGGSIFLPIMRVPPVNFQNLRPVTKIKYNKILTYILQSIFLEIPHLELPR